VNLEGIIDEGIITTTKTILREMVLETVETGEENSLRMNAVCTVVTNGATVAQTPITKRETTHTATPCPNAHPTETYATNVTPQAVQATAVAPAPPPITQEDNQQADVVTVDPLIRRNHA